MQFSSSRWSPPTVAAAAAAAASMSFWFLLYAAIVVVSCLIPGTEGLGSMTSMATPFSNNYGLESASAAPPVCGIHAQNQSIFCWNYNNNTSLQFTARNLTAVAFSGLAGGRDFFCGLRESTHQPFCWPLPNSSSNSNISSLKPTRLSRNQYTQIVVGELHVCAIQATTGFVDCWRSRSNKQAGGQQGASSPPPAKPFVSLTAGANFTCGLDSNWKMTCWGDGNDGFNITRSVDAAAQVQYQLISAGSSHMCGLGKLDGRLSCWGDNSFGQASTTMMTTASNSTIFFTALALGRAHSCGLQADTREVVCWGSNSFSQLDSPSGVQFASIAAGEDYTCGVEVGNLALICWGKGFSNNNTAVRRSSQIASAPYPPPPFNVEPGICQPSSSCLSGTYPLSSYYSNNTRNSVAVCNQPNNAVCIACSGECPTGYYESQSCGFQGDRKCTKITTELPQPKTRNRYDWRVLVPLSVIGGVGSLAGLLSVAWCFSNMQCCWIMKRRNSSCQCTTHSDENSLARVHNSSDVMENGELDKREDGINRQRVQSLASSNRSRRDLLNKTEIFEFDMLAAITDNFSDTHKIGAGSFGKVYKAELPDGKQVAIKRADKSGKKLEDIESPFQTELESLTRVHHKYLVQLVGYCDDGAERILVYDFISNGTLCDHLHNNGNNKDDYEHDKTAALNNWHVRIKIALQAARGIEYLHTYANPPLIHRDIKSSNILLDSSWTAQVSDFGLSIMGPSEEMSHLSMVGAGTLGFMDPEYFRLQHLTTKSDVYSFGVVLLELLTGKKAIHQGNSGVANLVDIAVPSILDYNSSLLSILDPRLYAPQGLELEAISMVAHVAEQCVKQEGKDRPSMTQVVNQLERAFDVSNLHKKFISAKSGYEIQEIDLQMRDEDADQHH